MPAKTAPMTGFEANCLAVADHFIACRGSKPATRIRARFDRINQAEAFAASFGDSRTMIYAVPRDAPLRPHQKRLKEAPMFTNLSAVQINRLAQRLSEAPFGRIAGVAAAAERFERLLTGKIGADRAPKAIKAVLTLSLIHI